MPLAFATPWALLALSGLVAVWWLLRIHPPAPRQILFPAIRLLLRLEKREEIPHTTPWWLLLLRMALFAAIVTAVAGPRWDWSPGIEGAGKLVVVVDDGWTAARGWEKTRSSVLQLIEEARQEGRDVVLAGTVPGTDRFATGRALPANEAAEIARVMEPMPWASDRRGFLERLVSAEWGENADVFWLWDGTDGNDAEATALLARQFARQGTLRLMEGPSSELPKILHPPLRSDPSDSKMRFRAFRTEKELVSENWVRALSDDGRLVTRVPLIFAEGAREAEAVMALPRELRGQIARAEIEGERQAGAVILLDDRWQRRTVGLVTAGDDYAARPLLAPTYYLARALEPFSEVRHGSLEEILSDPPSAIVFADVGLLRPEGRQAVQTWLDAGGTLIRFAGPRLVDAENPLLPVRLRNDGARTLGGVLSWEQPFGLGPFPERSPFRGLEVPADVLIERQMIAEPSPSLDEKTWARLADATPLVTAESFGAGEIVFFHVTANNDWSNLPLSGLFVNMLRRIVERAEGAEADAGEDPLPPLATLDAFGRETPPGADVRALNPERLVQGGAGPGNPPGYYGHELFRRALNLGTGIDGVEPYAGELPEGIQPEPRFGATRTDLSPWIYGFALLLLLVDSFVSLGIRGLLLRARPVAPGTLVVILLAGFFASTTVQAQEGVPAGALGVQFGYVITGSEEVDRASRLGLSTLGLILAARTSVIPVEPRAIRIESDPLALHPFIYWPITDDQPAITEETAGRIEDYLEAEGMIIFDTRDGSGLDQIGRRRGGDARLQRILSTLDLPPLVPAAPEHVLGRSFYLLPAFPGRWAGDGIWIERSASDSRDEIFSVLVGNAGWAEAWATDEEGVPLHPVVPGGERQRELAYRFGINLAIYSMTGNYKGDQVHANTILRRLRSGPDGR